ncbi:MAG: Eco57I restriction-modification methylase domain-containing protein [Acidobacteria bacterium]|nr:Eco57I restriction-modification methylase domain-containing protein [Acidobacteriota bacterium]
MFALKTNRLDYSGGGGNQTVFIRCKSDDLARLEHKPHFPGSDFHITIYDGTSKAFGQSLLGELQRFKWGVRVPLSGKVGLTVKELKNSNRRATRPEPVYDPVTKQLFWTITGHDLSWSYMAGLQDGERLALCRAILKSLFRETRHYERVSPRKKKFQNGTVSDSAIPRLPAVHLTPPELAREIAGYAVSQIENDDEPIDFGDPAVGTGAFYGALLQLLPPKRIASAIGVDINREQVAAAQWRWADKGMEVLNGDYLHMDRLPPRNLVLANPPYLRHQSIPRKYKSRLLERASIRTDIRVSARSGLYVYFLLLAHDWMSEGGVAAWLIPSEFMRSIYGSAVRQYLTQKVELLRVHVYGQTAPQFENVEVLPAIVVFRNRKPKPEHTVLMTAGGDLRTPETQEFVTVKDLGCSRTWNVPLRRKKEESGQFRIGDLFIVRRGIATGANDFFVVTREHAKSLGIPGFSLKPLLPKVKALGTDIVEAESDGYPKVSPQLCVIDCDLPETAIRKRYPRLMAYLNTAKNLGLLKRRLLADRNPWYKQEHRDPPIFLCTYMGRGSHGKPPLRFIWNRSQAIATNTYLLLYPRPSLAEMLSRDPTAASRVFAMLQQTAEVGFREYGRVHAGGLVKIEPRELLEVRLEVPSSLAIDAITDQQEFFR